MRREEGSREVTGRRVLTPGGMPPCRSVVVPLTSVHATRYCDLVARQRAAVREASGGRLGYLHIPATNPVPGPMSAGLLPGFLPDSRPKSGSPGIWPPFLPTLMASQVFLDRLIALEFGRLLDLPVVWIITQGREPVPNYGK